jgi:competence protein ComEA
MMTALLDRAMRRPAERTAAAARRRLDALGKAPRHGDEPGSPLVRSYTDPSYVARLPSTAWPTTPLPAVTETPLRPSPHARSGAATRLLGMARDRLPAVLRGRWSLDRRAGIALALVAAVGVAWAGWQLWRAEPRSTVLPAAPRSASGAWSARTVHDAAAIAPADTRPAVTAGPAASSTPSSADAWGGAPAAGSTGGPPASDASAGGTLVVDVAGAVRQPGIHRLPAGARVVDAIDASGGALAGTDLSPLNLARRLTDGEQIRVGLPATGPAPGDVPAPSGGHGRGKKGAATDSPVSLGQATVDQLQTLPGIGPALAQRIIDWRTQHGDFTSPDQLQQVPGIGPRKFAQLRALVRP